MRRWDWEGWASQGQTRGQGARETRDNWDIDQGTHGTQGKAPRLAGHGQLRAPNKPRATPRHTTRRLHVNSTHAASMNHPSVFFQAPIRKAIHHSSIGPRIATLDGRHPCTIRDLACTTDRASAPLHAACSSLLSRGTPHESQVVRSYRVGSPLWLCSYA